MLRFMPKIGAEVFTRGHSDEPVCMRVEEIKVICSNEVREKMVFPPSALFSDRATFLKERERFLRDALASVQEEIDGAKKPKKKEE